MLDGCIRLVFLEVPERCAGGYAISGSRLLLAPQEGVPRYIAEIAITMEGKVRRPGSRFGRSPSLRVRRLPNDRV
jgi:hypothetical protein